MPPSVAIAVLEISHREVNDNEGPRVVVSLESNNEKGREKSIAALRFGNICGLAGFHIMTSILGREKGIRKQMT